MELQHTGDGKPYLLVGREGNATKYRLTANREDYWFGEPEIRITRQMEGKGPDKEGPSIPLSVVGDFVKAIVLLMPELMEKKAWRPNSCV